ncbi:MAG: alpha/beta hydrolase, partial [Bacteroidetes bacterium]|nr:alpha/beta hydrolase [Bacteroidota bacterium]
MNLLLLHGALGASDYLRPLAAALEKDYTVHLLDFSGHGGKPFPGQPFSIPLFAEEVLSYMDSRSLDSVCIFGYSMGGYVGMWLALQHASRVSSLATLGTKWNWDPAVAVREIKMLNPQKIEEKVPALAQLLQKRHAPNDWKEVLLHTAALLTLLGEQPLIDTEILQTVKQPVLLMSGDADQLVDAGETMNICKAISGAQLGILPGTPHPLEKVD